jgi:peroxiredoxin
MFARIVVLGVVLVSAGCAATRPAAEVASRGPLRLPTVQLQTLEGRATGLAAALDGRVALVALWATWCKGCTSELDALTRLSERASALGAAVIGVAVGETRQAVSEFVSRRRLGYPQLVDEQFRLAEAIGQDRIPTTLVLDRQGRIIYMGGALDEQALAALHAQIKEPAALHSRLP